MYENYNIKIDLLPTDMTKKTQSLSHRKWKEKQSKKREDQREKVDWMKSGANMVSF